MPASHNETLPQRYEREHREYLSLLSKMPPEQIADLERQLHNARAIRDQLLAALNAMVTAFEYQDGSELYRGAALLKARSAIAAAEAAQPASAQQQGAPVGAGIQATVIASMLADAAVTDRAGDGYDIEAGLFGPALSAVIRDISVHTLTAPPAPACSVPDGYALVPVEPTPEMLSAAEYIDWGDADVRGSCHNMWNAMLAAAQKGGA